MVLGVDQQIAVEKGAREFIPVRRYSLSIRTGYKPKDDGC